MITSGREFPFPKASRAGRFITLASGLASDADGFAIVPGDGGDLQAGDAIEVDVIGWERVFTNAVISPSRA